MPKVGSWFSRASFGLFLALYVYAVAAYGLTRPYQVGIFQILAGFVFTLWGLGHVLQRRWPRISGGAWLVTGAILFFGWSVTGLGVVNDGIADRSLPWEGIFPEWLLDNWVSWKPEVSIQAMLRTSALLGTMLMAIDFWTDDKRGRLLIWTIILSTLVTVLFFFLQKIVGGVFVLHSEYLGWSGKALTPAPLAFVTYRYHGNAADYLNLAWPMAAAVAAFATFRQTPAWPLWFLPFAALFIANFLNVSKAGNVLAIVGLVLLLGLLASFALAELRRSRQKVPISLLIAAIVPVAIIAASLPFALPWERWDYLANNLDKESRLAAFREFLRMIPDGGAAGFGPGNFYTYVFVYLDDSPVFKNVGYTMAHQDYIQTLIEWGYVGTALWGLLFIPAFWFLFRKSRESSVRPSREFAGYRIGIFDHLRAFFETVPAPRESVIASAALTSVILVALHALADFPMQIPSLQFYFLNLIALGWSYRVGAGHRSKSPL